MDLIMKLIDIGTDKVTRSYNHQIELKRGKNDSDPFHLRRNGNHPSDTKNRLMLNQAIRQTLDRAR